jgi:hypothetical protein
MAKIKVYTLGQLIKRVERAKKIHAFWLKKVEETNKKGIKLTCDPGSIKWQKEWIDTYSALLNYLESSGKILGTDLKIKVLVK